MKPIPQHEAEKLKRENQKLKNQLKTLTQKATIVCQACDNTLFPPLLGKRMAALVNLLELETDGALHFGLHLDFKKINKLKTAAKNWAVKNIP